MRCDTRAVVVARVLVQEELVPLDQLRKDRESVGRTCPVPVANYRFR